MGIGLQITFLIIHFAQLIQGNFTILGSRLYSPNLKDVAELEDAQVVVNFLYICLCFSPRSASTQLNLQTNVWKIENLIELLLTLYL